MKTPLFALLLLSLSTACTSGPIGKAALDDEVKRLCAIDGGIKVFETVKLPTDKFNEWGKPNFRIPRKSDAKPGDEYYYEWNIHYYRKGNPELSRDHFAIIRRSDEKTLGEAIYYGRGGGDLPGPWHESSFRCPDAKGQTSLESSIFQQEIMK